MAVWHCIFYNHASMPVQRAWHAPKTQNHCTAAAEELCFSAEDTREYPWRIKMLSLGSTLLILYTFATVLFCTYMGWSAFLSLFGPWRVRTLNPRL